MTEVLKISIDELQFDCDLRHFDSKQVSTETDHELIGQDRARKALQFGVAMPYAGYNIYVMGETGTGKLSLVKRNLHHFADTSEHPCSYAYINNFYNTKEPGILELPYGQEASFCSDIENLLDNILTTIPAAFENPAYQQQKNTVEQKFDFSYEQALGQVEKAASASNIALFRDTSGIIFTPVKDNKTLDEDQFALLTQQEREQFHQQVAELQKELAKQLLLLPQWRRETAEQLNHLNHDTLISAIKPLFDTLRGRYQNCHEIVQYLDAMQQDLIVFSLKELLLQESGSELSQQHTQRQRLISRYLPNIIINSASEPGRPVVYEAHPNFQNLFGRIEYSNEHGVLTTHFRNIFPGSIHRANGGYLILDAEKLLVQPKVWQALKRALKSNVIEMDDCSNEQGVSALSLKPKPIPLQVKIILIGSREIYYLLQEMDDEFDELFRVLADFDDYFSCDSIHIQQFAELSVRHYRTLSDKTLTHAAIVELLKHSARLAEHQKRLSARINETMEVVTEAEFYRKLHRADTLQKSHVQQAIRDRASRSGRIAKTLLDEILDGTILIDCCGAAIGKANGLTVLDVGDSSFGAAARITATVHPGSKGVVDIEREADLGQSIHSKGVLILTGYLGHCYAQTFPFSFSASIAIEQSYGYIDGDSASLAELCALISALTEIPLKQNLALTGSINQYGEVQAIGGVNEKIEGFFQLCQARGLSGDQGVIIPAANRQNLVLNDEVMQAVTKQQFSLYAITHADQALQLLTGMEIGNRDEQGNFPESSLNHLIIKRLKQITDISAEKEEHGHHEHDSQFDKTEEQQVSQ